MGGPRPGRDIRARDVAASVNPVNLGTEIWCEMRINVLNRILAPRSSRCVRGARDQDFRRGYGMRATGGFSVMGGVLSVIVNLRPIR